jgi:hypothetical protein
VAAPSPHTVSVTTQHVGKGRTTAGQQFDSFTRQQQKNWEEIATFASDFIFDCAFAE